MSSTSEVDSELSNIITSSFTPLIIQLITSNLSCYFLSYYFINYTPFINYYLFINYFFFLKILIE